MRKVKCDLAKVTPAVFLLSTVAGTGEHIFILDAHVAKHTYCYPTGGGVCDSKLATLNPDIQSIGFRHYRCKDRKNESATACITRDNVNDNDNV